MNYTTVSNHSYRCWHFLHYSTRRRRISLVVFLWIFLEFLLLLLFCFIDGLQTVLLHLNEYLNQLLRHLFDKVCLYVATELQIILLILMMIILKWGEKYMVVYYTTRVNCTSPSIAREFCSFHSRCVLYFLLSL